MRTWPRSWLLSGSVLGPSFLPRTFGQDPRVQAPKGGARPGHVTLAERPPEPADYPDADPIPAGDHQVRLAFADHGGGLAKGGTASLFFDGRKVGEGRVDGTVPMACSAAETTDIGSDTATRVTDDIADDTEWNGRVRCVELAIDDAEDADQLIAPEERYRIAMARR